MSICNIETAHARLTKVVAFIALAYPTRSRVYAQWYLLTTTIPSKDYAIAQKKIARPHSDNGQSEMSAY